MSCRELSDQQLWLFLDRECGADERRAIEAHLAGCADCPDRLAAMRRRPLTLGEQRLMAPPPDFQRRVMARILVDSQANWRERHWAAPLWSPRRAAGFAGTALLVSLSSALIVGAALAAPLVAAVPAEGPPLANSMALAVRGLVQPLQGLFRAWAWLILLLGMLAVLVVLAARAMIVHLRRSI
ncbi:MAG: zf-HC2 domain-containing protein [Chloroflexi bacterium]|nr:zf-HC2 domain-containing protein [Chloroflexota bacterium]